MDVGGISCKVSGEVLEEKVLNKLIKLVKLVAVFRLIILILAIVLVKKVIQ